MEIKNIVHQEIFSQLDKKTLDKIDGLLTHLNSNKQILEIVEKEILNLKETSCEFYKENEDRINVIMRRHVFHSAMKNKIEMSDYMKIKNTFQNYTELECYKLNRKITHDLGKDLVLTEKKIDVFKIALELLKEKDNSVFLDYLENTKMLSNNEITKIEKAFLKYGAKNDLLLVTKFYEKTSEDYRNSERFFKINPYKLLLENNEDLLNFTENYKKLFYTKYSNKNFLILRDLINIDLSNRKAYSCCLADLFYDINDIDNKEQYIHNLETVLNSVNLDIKTILKKFDIEIKSNGFEGILESAYFVCHTDNKKVINAFETESSMEQSELWEYVQPFSSYYYANKLNNKLIDKKTVKQRKI